MTRGKLCLTKEPVELTEIIARAIEMASPALEQRRHQLDLDIESDGLVVDGDPMRLAQVIFNLLTNAARYSSIGGRSVLSARRQGEDIVLSVRDNGIGVPQPLLPHVFDLFQQGPRGLDQAENGLGVGLAIVRNLVELHGGSVSVSSEGIGKGSEFVIRLPAAETWALNAAEPNEQTALPDSHNTGARRVLIVDDNEDTAAMLAELLQYEGYVARYVYDAPSALDIVRDFAPDVILIDIGLPVMNGYELAHRLRNLPELASSTLVALTGYGQEADRRRALQAGFDEHLVKPLDFSQLWRVLQAPDPAASEAGS
jgi:CheY-like chemotaxis protein